MKKILALLLAAVMCIFFVACGDNSPTESPYDDTTEPVLSAPVDIEPIPETSEDIQQPTEPETSQQPTESNVISIYTAEELFSTAYNSNKTYILENDIDLTNYASSISELNGIFDGNGKIIRNSSAPLILKNSGTIQNLTIEDCQITAAEDTAALVVNNSGTISGCKVSGSVNAAAKNIYAGGIVSRNIGTIENCANYAEITAVSYALNELGNVVHGTFACAGGISATNHYGTISQCWNEGTISAKDADYLSSCGGIVALNTHGNIENCYNTGTVIKPEGRGDSGGIAGNSEANGRIVNCYNVGAVSSGICGDNRDYIIDCYYLSSMSENGSGSGLNPEGERIFAFSEGELTIQKTFSAFDFATVWKMSENGPVLQ